MFKIAPTGALNVFPVAILTTPLFLTINVLPGTIVTPSERKFVFTD